MIVVADTGALNYMMVIDVIGVLEPLDGCVVVPRSVEAESLHSDAPALVRTWVSHPPVRFEVHDDPPADPTLGFLDAGERAGLALAERCAPMSFRSMSVPAGRRRSDGR